MLPHNIEIIIVITDYSTNGALLHTMQNANFPLQRELLTVSIMSAFIWPAQVRVVHSYQVRWANMLPDSHRVNY